MESRALPPCAHLFDKCRHLLAAQVVIDFQQPADGINPMKFLDITLDILYSLAVIFVLLCDILNCNSYILLTELGCQLECLIIRLGLRYLFTEFGTRILPEIIKRT